MKRMEVRMRFQEYCTLIVEGRWSVITNILCCVWNGRKGKHLHVKVIMKFPSCLYSQSKINCHKKNNKSFPPLVMSPGLLMLWNSTIIGKQPNLMFCYLLILWPALTLLWDEINIFSYLLRTRHNLSTCKRGGFVTFCGLKLVPEEKYDKILFHVVWGYVRLKNAIKVKALIDIPIKPTTAFLDTSHVQNVEC